MSNKTLAILKPDCVRKNLIGKVISHIQDAGFKILAMKMVRLTPDSAKGFYEIHKERPFFNDLIAYMTSGPCVPIVLEKENAVEEFRKLIGATDPAKAEEGTIRKLYADNIQENIVHGSDSNENALKEIAHFFSRKELLEINGWN
ncbi:nucleoside-diphosphate kinase [Rosettibacter firmus]|uniref:nucleoside-diphosphate kinase n=1 Tax=Rosettibacter firmus TaxID=3111522 RepID=UPI00336BCD9E